MQSSGIGQPLASIPPGARSGAHHFFSTAESWAIGGTFSYTIESHRSFHGHAEFWHWTTISVHTSWAHHIFRSTNHWASIITITSFHGHASFWSHATISIHRSGAPQFFSTAGGWAIGGTFS